MGRICCQCEYDKHRDEYGTNQWSKGDGFSRCRSCVDGYYCSICSEQFIRPDEMYVHVSTQHQTPTTIKAKSKKKVPKSNRPQYLNLFEILKHENVKPKSVDQIGYVRQQYFKSDEGNLRPLFERPKYMLQTPQTIKVPIIQKQHQQQRITKFPIKDYAKYLRRLFRKPPR